MVAVGAQNGASKIIHKACSCFVSVAKMPYKAGMVNKTRRFDSTDAQQLLEAIDVARHACVQAGHKAPIRGEVYQTVQKVMDAIDEAAFVLTGKRDHFWLKPHSAPSYTSRATPGNCSGE